MENTQENKQENEPSFGFKPNYKIVFLLTILIFFAAFMGALLANVIGSGMIFNKIKKLFDKKDTIEKPPVATKPKPKMIRIQDDEDLDGVSDDESTIEKHKRFRDSENLTSID